MDTALPQKFPFILDRNLAKANCIENHVCTSCDKVVLDLIYCYVCIFFTRCFGQNIPFPAGNMRSIDWLKLIKRI